MSWEEDCAAGLLYDSTASEREAEHLRCADLCWEYNRTRPSDMAGRERLLRQIFGKLGAEPYVEPNLFCGFGYNIEAGDHFFVNNNCVFVDPGKIIFGDYVFVGPQCGFYTAVHPLDAQQRDAGLEAAYPICVGSHVWFGGGVKVLPGVTIGSDVVIGAGSVVSQDIPDHVLAVGNPCRAIRPITSEDRNRYQVPEYLQRK